MSISTTLVMIAGLALSACANAPESEADRQIPLDRYAEVETACGLPAGSLTGKETLDLAEAGPKMACVVDEARKRNLPIGFISNPVDPDA